MSGSPSHRVEAFSNKDRSRSSTIVRAENLSLRYGKQTAFKNITLSVPVGQITAIVGPSGCGKTSFLLCMNRLTDLVAGCEITGSLLVKSSDVVNSQVDVLALRRQVGMIFQHPNPFPLSIRKNLDFPLREHGVGDPRKRAEIAERALEDVGLWDEVKDRLGASALSLSGGQQQRLCIARALALGPEILLMDEPCSALDPISSAVVEDLILGLREEYTLVVVTHNLAQARRIADHAALFWLEGGSGRLVESGPARQFFEQPREELTAAYLQGARG